VRVRNRIALPLVALIAMACAGVKAREFVLLPNMQAAWATVEELALEGSPNDRVSDLVNEFGRVLMAGDLELLEQQPITLIVATARIGITSLLNSGQIGPAGVESLTETVDLFLAAYMTLTEVR
jgi:hypothetical protein